MKFKTGFTFPYGRWVPLLSAAGWMAAGLGLLLGLCMAWAAHRDRQEIPGLETRLAEIKGSPAPKTAVTGRPLEGDPALLGTRLRELNGLGAGKGESIPSILRGLEGLLPEGTRLGSFQADQRTGQVQLVVEARNLECLSQTLAALEKDGGFEGVNLGKQGQGPGGDTLQFSIDMRVKP